VKSLVEHFLDYVLHNGFTLTATPDDLLISRQGIVLQWPRSKDYKQDVQDLAEAFFADWLFEFQRETSKMNLDENECILDSWKE
jgi:hypothetical protein